MAPVLPALLALSALRAAEAPSTAGPSVQAVRIRAVEVGPVVRAVQAVLDRPLLLAAADVPSVDVLVPFQVPAPGSGLAPVAIRLPPGGDPDDRVRSALDASRLPCALRLSTSTGDAWLASLHGSCGAATLRAAAAGGDDASLWGTTLPARDLVLELLLLAERVAPPLVVGVQDDRAAALAGLARQVRPSLRVESVGTGTSTTVERAVRIWAAPCGLSVASLPSGAFAADPAGPCAGSARSSVPPPPGVSLALSDARRGADPDEVRGRWSLSVVDEADPWVVETGDGDRPDSARTAFLIGDEATWHHLERAATSVRRRRVAQGIASAGLAVASVVFVVRSRVALPRWADFRPDRDDYGADAEYEAALDARRDAWEAAVAAMPVGERAAAEDDAWTAGVLGTSALLVGITIPLAGRGAAARRALPSLAWEREDLEARLAAYDASLDGALGPTAPPEDDLPERAP